MIHLVRKRLRHISWLRRLKRRSEFRLWQARIWTRTRLRRGTVYDPYRIYWIDPARIERYLVIKASNSEKPFEESGTIMDGDWDLRTNEFHSLDVYRAFRDRFENGKPWDKTDYYARVLGDIEAGRLRWNCADKGQFHERLKAIEDLYKNILAHGYRSQAEIATSGYGEFESCGVEDEIRVHIDRHGEYLFADGRHRLSIAKILNLETVPVKVSRRHRKWADLREDILSYARENGGRVYQPITHADLADIPSVHGSKRWDFIRPHVSGMTGSVLDIGANWGYFCHCFESIGFDCLAIEHMPRDAYFLRKLRWAKNRRFRIVEASIFGYEGVLDFTVVLCLNIFHHFLKEKSLFRRLTDFLERLNCRMMFFQPHLPDEPQMQGAYRNYSEQEFVKFIQEKARLRWVELLGKDDDGRSLYKLAR